MLLSVIIVSYNTQQLTVQTLVSVFENIENSALLKKTTEVVVVDNNSSDSTVAELKKLQKKYPYLRLILNTQNVGFAKANNQAVEKTSGKYVLLLNSDTIVHEGALEKMVQTFESHPVDDSTSALGTEKGTLDRLGVLAATLLNKDGSIQAQGGSFPTLLSLLVHMWMLDDIPLFGKFLPSTQHTGKSSAAAGIFQKEWVGGTAMMIRRAVFEEVGALDQNIFMYGEDVEFCMRAKNHQWDVAILPTAKITHFGSGSSSSQNALIGEVKGYIYIWSKHKPLWQMKYLKFILRWGARLRVFLFTAILSQKERAVPYQILLRDVLPLEL